MSAGPEVPRRILMTADTVGGVWTYATDLSRAFGEMGIEVVLATMGGLPSREQRRELRSLRGVELVESEYRLPWMDHPWNDVETAGEWLLKLAARFQADVVHLNEPVYGSLAWSSPTVVVAHSDVFSWWQSVWRANPPDDWERYRWEMTQGLRQADRLVAPSHWLLETLRQNFGVTQGQVIANGRHAEAFYPEQKEAIVFAAGRLWDPAKNLLLLESLAPRLGWPVYIAGNPQHPSRKETAAAPHLCLLGQLSTSEVAWWLRRAGIYAFPARYEPFGLSVLEAALAGCALVLGDLDTLRELWDGAAVFVSPDEPETLRLALDALIADSDLRQALAMRARRRALRLTPRRMAQAYIGLYTELIGDRVHGEDHACVS